MTTESTSADDATRRDGSRLSEGLGAPERAAFEAHMDASAPPYWRTTAHAREAWDLWRACWPLARAAIYSAEQAQIEAPLRAKIELLQAELAAKDRQVAALIDGNRQREAELRSYIR